MGYFSLDIIFACKLSSASLVEFFFQDDSNDLTSPPALEVGYLFGSPKSRKLTTLS